MSEAACPWCGRALFLEEGPSTSCPQCGGVIGGGRTDTEESSDPGLVPPLPGMPIPGIAGSGKSSSATAGTMLPRILGYEVLERIGEGEHGVVYKARQTGLKRLVALKILEGLQARAEDKLRFRLEAQALARLGEEHLVQIFDVGECESGLYYAMEFCPRGNLAETLDRETLNAVQAAHLVEILARAVQAAHARSVVHGNLSAGDVFWAEDGSAKIAGFGLRRLMQGVESTIEDDVRGLGVLLARCAPKSEVQLEAIARRCQTGQVTSAGELAEQLNKYQRIWDGGGKARYRWRDLVGELRELRAGVLLASMVMFVLLFTGLGLIERSSAASIPLDLSRADIWLGARGGTFTNRPSLSEAWEGWLSRHPGVTRVETCLLGEALWRSPEEAEVRCMVLGGNLDAGALGPCGMLTSRQREKLRQPDTVIVCQADLGQLGVQEPFQQSLWLGPQRVNIVEVTSYPAAYPGPMIFCAAETARRVLELPEDQVSFVLGSCDDPGAVVRAIREETPAELKIHSSAGWARSVRLQWLGESWLARIWCGLGLVSLVVTGLILGRWLRSMRNRPSWVMAGLVGLGAGLIGMVWLRLVVWLLWPAALDYLKLPLLQGTAVLASGILMMVMTVEARRIKQRSGERGRVPGSTELRVE